jgi:uncharacterized membrane protein
MDDLIAKLIKTLEKPYPAMGLGAAITGLLIILYHLFDIGRGYWGPFFTFLHVISGVTWIGLLYYFNLVQIPTMPNIPAELKPAIGKYIAPEALWWFRWAAASTVATGIIVFSSGTAVVNLTIVTGALLGLVMAYNVWFIIWPNQQRVLGIAPADDEAKAKSARVAMLASRTNFVLSIPMLYCMVTARLVG